MGGCNSAVYSDDEEIIEQGSRGDFVRLCEIPELICFNPSIFSNDCGGVFIGEFSMKKVSISKVEQQKRMISERETAILRRLDDDNVI